MFSTIQHSRLAQVQQLRLHIYHSSLQRKVPQLAFQFPGIQRLALSGCSALPESWLQAAAEAWPVKQLDVDTLLSVLLEHNPQLTRLDLAGNSCLPSRCLQWALRGAHPSLRMLSLQGCQQLTLGLVSLDLADTSTNDADLRALAGCLSRLQWLSIKGCRQVADEGLMALAGSPALQQGRLCHLDASGLTRTSGTAVENLLRSWVCSVLDQDARAGVLSCSRTSGRHIHAAATAAAAIHGQHKHQQLLHVALSHTAGAGTALATLSQLGRVVAIEGRMSVPLAASAAPSHSQQGFISDSVCTSVAGSGRCSNDEVAEVFAERLRLTDCKVDVAATAPAAAAATSPLSRAAAAEPAAITTNSDAVAAVRGLCGLEVAGCSMSGDVLAGLAASGVLTGLTRLDLSDMECLRLRQQRTEAVSSCDDLGCSSTIFQQLFAFTGGCMLSLTLDGCYVDCLAAAAVARGCPRLQQLSVVGCKGLCDVGLQALVQCSSHMVALAVGGAAGNWAEGIALSGLTGLTELQVIRRSNVTDAALAPLLAANSKLRSLSLIGCYCLTDQLFDLAVGCQTSSAVPAPGAAAGTAGFRASISSSGCLGVQHQLTQLVLVACDGLVGSTLSKLRGLQRLRVSFCSRISRAAVQQVTDVQKGQRGPAAAAAYRIMESRACGILTMGCTCLPGAVVLIVTCVV
eukprot:gene5872-6113_t